jgi:hypothetical protein
MNDVDLLFAKEGHHPAQLNYRISIKETAERIAANIADPKFLEFTTEWAIAVERSDEDRVAAALDEQSRQLCCLPFRSTLAEAVD